METKIDKDMAKVFEEFLVELNFNTNLYNEHMVQPEEIRDKLPYWTLKLSVPEVNVLQALMKNGSLMTVGEVAQKTGIHKKVMTRPVKHLIEMGFVKRLQKPDNYRYVYIDLTDKGRAVIENQIDIRYKYLMSKFYGVVTKEEVKKIKEAMEFYNSILKRVFVSKN